VEEIVKYREQKDFITSGDVKSAIGITDTLFAKLNPLIKVNSSFFTVKSRYSKGNVIRSVEALLQREGGTVSVVSWREF
jgi:hypothetical protein